MMMMPNVYRIAPLLCCLMLISACVSTPTLYEWDDYQATMYHHFQGKPQIDKIPDMEKGLEKMRAANKTPPPGFHAYLGFLYSETAQNTKAIEQFNAEKKLFPESEAYMNFILKKYGKQ
jgi:hypothetical protein